MDKDVIDMALAFDMWVFGGYVRDVVVRGLPRYNDIDLMCTDEVTMRHFVRMLELSFNVRYHNERTFAIMYGGMSPGVSKLHKCVVSHKGTETPFVRVDVVVFEGEFRDWCRERTTDFTCNLFYMKRDVSLGIRYVPTFLKNTPHPMKHLLEMTRAGEFQRIWDVSLRLTPQWMHVVQIHERAKELVKRGWHLMETPALMTPSMSLEILDRPYAGVQCARAMALITMLQNRRAIRQLVMHTKKVDPVLTCIERNLLAVE